MHQTIVIAITPKVHNIIEASFLSGLSKINTKDISGNSQKKWRPKNIYHYIQWKNLNPDFIFDVSGFHSIKMDAVKCYSSQFYNPKSKEPETPISKMNFLDFVDSRAADFGRLIGVDHGEGFIFNRVLGITSFENNLKFILIKSIFLFRMIKS